MLSHIDLHRMLSRSEISRHLVQVCHRLYERGLVTATDGNVSARLPDGNILITPAGVNKGALRESDLVEVRPDGTPLTLSRKPSTELPMHLFIYERRPDVHAVVHAHPPFATGFAVARQPLPDSILPEVIVGLGTVPLAEYATPSTDGVAASLMSFIQTATAVLLSNHGVVTYGPALDDAAFKMEKVEHAAHITFVARFLGGEQVLGKRELGELGAIAPEKYGKSVVLPVPPAATKKRKRKSPGSEQRRTRRKNRRI